MSAQDVFTKGWKSPPTSKKTPDPLRQPMPVTQKRAELNQARNDDVYRTSLHRLWGPCNDFPPNLADNYRHPPCGGQGLAARAEGRPLTYLLDTAHGGLLLTDRGFSPQYAPLLAGHI